VPLPARLFRWGVTGWPRMDCRKGAKRGEGHPTPFPYSNWGPVVGVLGVFLALIAGAILGVPALLGHKPHGVVTSFARSWEQLAAEGGFLLVPIVIAARWGATSIGQALRSLGVRSFRFSEVKWMAAVIGIYLLFTFSYTTLIGKPHQNFGKGFGAVPFQVLLIVVMAPICEEVCFRGMLFSGLRERLPLIAAAAISGAIFGGLHALTGISAVPPLIVFGFLLALLYEKTGSIIPGILLHALNNSVALLAHH
jgi:membrane protease YdiL (CAAX protease family)